MRSLYWIKLYHEILRDPKMGRLPDRAWRRCIELFLLAGENGMDGVLPSLEDIAWGLRIPMDELTEDVETLKAAGIIHQNDGHLIVTNFAERQAASSNAERQAQYRDRQRLAQYYGDEQGTDEQQRCNGTETRTQQEHNDTGDNSVTKCYTEPEKNQSREESEKTWPPSAGAGAPATLPSTFPDWQQFIRDAQGRPGGYPAALRVMFEHLYPGRDPPDYGYLGKIAKRVGGAGRLADLLWQYSTRPPTGDVLAYIQGVTKSDGKRNGNRGKTLEKPSADPVDPDQVARDREALRQHRARRSSP
jgi:hypothetical protein